ncbi:MAG: CoA-acylating methylmalonate-semialdehyde dehydrogenase [Pseudomonadota bacterium]|nr:CoA-acylating methylmalonate-semialdehyde dehydrogenase [Pseudomonadota bacterium]
MDVHHFINGKQTAGTSNNWQPLHDPLTNQIAKRVIYADIADVNNAVDAAKTAFPAWSSTTPAKRSQVLFRYKNLLDQHADVLAQLVMEEHGKTLGDAKASVQRGIAVVEFACGISQHLQTQYSVAVGTNIDGYSLRQPLGVCVGITPFNFPVMIPLWMFPIAIACGNTFVLKPSERDPSVTVKLAELMQAAGLPDGVLNVLHGDKNAVDALITHRDVVAVSSVGSTPVAQHIYQTASLHHKRVQAFGGAKNHALVMPDADLEHAANAIFGAAFGSAGERCMAISVVVAVTGAIADQLVEKLTKLNLTLKIGAGSDPSVSMGPLVTREHWHRVLAHIETGVHEGAKLIIDGRQLKIAPYPDGNFLGACLFDHVTPQMTIYTNEIFGPVLCIVRVDDFAEGLELINNNPYGNGTAIFTADANIAREFSLRVQAGMVGINVPIPVPAGQFSFGGWKNSIFADLHMHGAEGVQFYTKLKTVTATWPSTPHGPEFQIPTGA